MWEQVRSAFDESLQRAVSGVAAFLPRLMAVLLILTLALVVAAVLRVLLRRFLRGIRFDTLLHRWGVLSAAPPQKEAGVASRWVMASAFWGVLLIGLVMSLLALNLPGARTISRGLLDLLPRVLTAAAILVAGLGLARYLERSILISAVNLQVYSARLLSVGVRWLVGILAAAMALEHLGIGGGILPMFFGILFGGIVLALALAFGLGSRDVVSRSLEKRLQQREEPEPKSDVQHI